jgi:hypothetical protein
MPQSVGQQDQIYAFSEIYHAVTSPFSNICHNYNTRNY